MTGLPDELLSLFAIAKALWHKLTNGVCLILDAKKINANVYAIGNTAKILSIGVSMILI